MTEYQYITDKVWYYYYFGEWHNYFKAGKQDKIFKEVFNELEPITEKYMRLHGIPLCVEENYEAV